MKVAIHLPHLDIEFLRHYYLSPTLFPSLFGSAHPFIASPFFVSLIHVVLVVFFAFQFPSLSTIYCVDYLSILEFFFSFLPLQGWGLPRWMDDGSRLVSKSISMDDGFAGLDRFLLLSFFFHRCDR